LKEIKRYQNNISIFSLFNKKTKELQETSINKEITKTNEIKYRCQSLEDMNSILVKKNLKLEKECEFLKEANKKLLFEAEIIKNNKTETSDKIICNSNTENINELFLDVELISISIGTKYG